MDPRFPCLFKRDLVTNIYHSWITVNIHLPVFGCFLPPLLSTHFIKPGHLCYLDHTVLFHEELRRVLAVRLRQVEHLELMWKKQCHMKSSSVGEVMRIYGFGP